MDNRNSYTYRKYESNKLRNEFLSIAALVVVLLVLQFTTHLSATLALFILIGVLVFLKASEIIISELKRSNYLTWGRGAGAEWTVGKELERLPFSYELIPDFNTGHGNIDHVCIGETGIFAIEVKATEGVVSNSGNQLLINGEPTKDDYIGQARAEAHFLKMLLKEKTGKEYPVVGMLIFPYANVIIRQQINEIWIGSRGFCNWQIKRRPKVLLTDTEVDRIIDILTQFEVK